MAGNSAFVNKTRAVKMDWYQTDKIVTLQYFERNVDEKSVVLKCSKNNVNLQMILRDGTEYYSNLQLEYDILWDKCSFKSSPSKLEVRLVKADTVHWTKLESAEKSPCLLKSRNWDAVVKEIGEGDNEETSSVNGLFQKIYNDGSDDLKRAMNKSFIESKGTILSTNWENVKAKEQRPLE